MRNESNLSEQESLKLITEMIHKVKTSYHDTGISPLLWGSTVFVASMVTYFKLAFGWELPFDIWLLTLFAIVPQIIISWREAKQKRFKSHQDTALDAVWITYAVTLFGLIAYGNIVPGVTKQIINNEGWQLVRDNLNATPDEVIKPFLPSYTSLFILVYAMPTIITGVIRSFKPMIIGAALTYLFFIVSCFTTSKYDMLLSAATALSCWFIPGIILRKRYLEGRRAHV